MRLFAGLSLNGMIPDHTAIMNFRHLLKHHDLVRKIFNEVNDWLSDAGALVKDGTLMDTTIIAAPNSTKNKAGEHDPEMHQTKKGNQWHFGMKAHIGVDARTGLTHSLTTTAANEHYLNLGINEDYYYPPTTSKLSSSKKSLISLTS